MEAVNAANLVLLLQNTSVVPVFRLYCCSLRLEDYLDVYFVLEKFHLMHESGNKPDKPLAKHATEIMDKYFSDESLYKLDHINASAIQTVKEDIKKEITATIFQTIKQSCFQILEERALSSFITSPCYVTFIST